MVHATNSSPPGPRLKHHMSFGSHTKTRISMAPPLGSSSKNDVLRMPSSIPRPRSKRQLAMTSVDENSVTVGSTTFSRAQAPLSPGSQSNMFLQGGDSSISDFLSMVQACPRPLSRTSSRSSSITDSPSMSRVISSPALHTMSQTVPLPGLDDKVESPQKPKTKKKVKLHHSSSAPVLDSHTIFGGRSATTSTSNASWNVHPHANTNPQDHLNALMKALDVSTDTHPSLSLKNFFLETTQEHIDGYDAAIINAVRSQDLQALDRLCKSGATLQCCNKFGESIVHMACRRGSIDVLRFLLQHGVSVRVCDDYGRTCLHDACWTQEPQLELVKIIIQECPDLLYMKDKRGFTPLAYVRRDHWAEWCTFLEEHSELLAPKDLKC